MSPKEIVVAIVDDDESVRRALQRMVLSLSFDPVGFQSGDDFVASLDRRMPDCVLLDVHMPGLSGLGVLRKMTAGRRHVPAIAITGFDQPGLREKCLDAGAVAYLIKPLDSSEVANAIENATAA
ncbi:response regulator [Stappia sp. GBMRC 2046]|uniref:Response regulator n=1 Tax=Stappia sediminis TaxID=2692190 RepID=A0A7X3LSC4_9HYPH|nr:response regulator [Stappia sediminis]MXN64227.1 response regulator [Stappia sediminis]